MANKILFEFTIHAKYQMTMRGISQKTVEFTVLNPQRVYGDSTDAALLVAEREIDGGSLIKVWYRFLDGEAVVLSCLIVTVRRELEQPRTQKAKGRK